VKLFVRKWHNEHADQNDQNYPFDGFDESLRLKISHR
jgi:hypothetical protein